MKISAATNRGTGLSLSNFSVRSGVGYQAKREELTELIESQGFNAKKIANALNAHPYTVRQFSVESETSKLIKIKAVDSMSNVSYIQIVK